MQPWARLERPVKEWGGERWASEEAHLRPWAWLEQPRAMTTPSITSCPSCCCTISRSWAASSLVLPLGTACSGKASKSTRHGGRGLLPTGCKAMCRSKRPWAATTGSGSGGSSAVLLVIASQMLPPDARPNTALACLPSSLDASIGHDTRLGTRSFRKKLEVCAVLVAIFDRLEDTITLATQIRYDTNKTAEYAWEKAQMRITLAEGKLNSALVINKKDKNLRHMKTIFLCLCGNTFTYKQRLPYIFKLK